MVALGFLSILQAAFLPGWLITKLLPSISWLRRLLVSFALSLVFNQLLVITLILLKSYTQATVLRVIAVELLVLFSWWFIQRHSIKPLIVSWNIAGIKRLHWGYPWLLGFAIIALSIVIGRVASVNPGVFNVWDDFVAYNEWALVWYNGHFAYSPSNFYPQFIPVLWSLMYKVIGNIDIQFFAKAVMGLFPIGLVLIFFDLFLVLRKSAFLFGAIFCSFLISIFAWGYIGSGYTELPAAFFAYLAVSLLIPYMLGGRRQSLILNLLLATIFAAMTALIKKFGLYLALPLFIGGWLSMRQQRLPIWQAIKWLLVSMAIFSLVAGHWYINRAWQVWGRHDRYIFTQLPMIDAMVTRQNNSSNIWGRLTSSTNQFVLYLGGDPLIRKVRTALSVGDVTQRPVWQAGIVIAVNLFWLLLVFYAWQSALARYLLLAGFVPYYLIWSAWLSYDCRNLIIMLPFLALVFGLGFANLCSTFIKWRYRLILSTSGSSGEAFDLVMLGRSSNVSISQKSHSFAISLPLLTAIGWSIAIIGVAWLQSLYSIDELYAIREQKMYYMGSRYIDNALYDYQEHQGFIGKIETTYYPAGYMPKLKDIIMYPPDINVPTLSLPLLKMAEQDPQIGYIFWFNGDVPADTATYIDAKIASGRYHQIFDIQNFKLIQIRSSAAK